VTVEAVVPILLPISGFNAMAARGSIVEAVHISKLCAPGIGRIFR